MAPKNKQQPVRRRQYTAEEKQSVVTDAEALGVTAAAHKHDVSISNVSRWLSRSRQTQSATHSKSKGSGPSKSAHSKTKPAKASKRPLSSSSKKTSAEHIAKKYTPSQIAEALERADRDGVGQAAKALGMSRFSIYYWRKKSARAAKGEGPAPTSGPDPKTIEAQRDEEILSEWKRHPGLGPSQIRNQLRRKNIKVSTHTVRRVMEDEGYRPPKVKRRPHDQYYEAVRPNHLWHLDYVHRYINRTKAHVLILIDDHSRYVTGHGFSEAEQADFVVQTFEEAVQRHGRPEMVIHDKGSAFWSWRGISRFTQLLTELGIDQIVAQHKEWNGKLEVFNGNLHKEFFDVQRFHNLAEMRHRLTAHLHGYNHIRTHHALGGLLVPADPYYGRSEEVLAQIEAGHGRDLKEFDLRDRRLELFKIVTERGIPEVWLMGHRLLNLK